MFDFSSKIYLLDGAMATEIQRRSASSGKLYIPAEDLALIALSNPDLLSRIHRDYIEAGSDIIKTHTCNLASLDLSGRKSEMNAAAVASVKLALKEAKTATHRVLTAATMGGWPVALSRLCGRELSDGITKMKNTLSLLSKIYKDEGVDLLLLETQYDLLSLRETLDIVVEFFPQSELLVSATLSKDGKSLYGAGTLRDYVKLLKEYTPLATGFNCGFNPSILVTALDELQSLHIGLCLYPSLENLTQTHEEELCDILSKPLQEGKLNIVGGCCGTTPHFIRLLAATMRQGRPHRI